LEVWWSLASFGAVRKIVKFKKRVQHRLVYGIRVRQICKSFGTKQSDYRDYLRKLQRKRHDDSEIDEWKFQFCHFLRRLPWISHLTN
jgi:hypothetical protein